MFDEEEYKKKLDRMSVEQLRREKIKMQMRVIELESKLANLRKEAVK